MDSFEAVQDEIDWARGRIDEAHAIFDAYAGEQPFAFVGEEDPYDFERIVLKLKKIKPVPSAVGHLLRNALLDIKHSFDRSLFIAARNMGQLKFDANYPWSESIIGLKKILRKRQSREDTRLPIPLIKEIFAQKPYAGPEYPPSREYVIRRLAHLANDKHSVGFVVSPRGVRTRIRSFTCYDAVPMFGPWDNVKEEMTVGLIYPGGQIICGDAELSTHITFKTAGVVGEVPAFYALAGFADRAQTCLEGFKRVVET